MFQLDCELMEVRNIIDWHLNINPQLPELESVDPSTKDSSQPPEESEKQKLNTYDTSILAAFVKLLQLIEKFIDLDYQTLIEANFAEVKVILANFEQITEHIK